MGSTQIWYFQKDKNLILIRAKAIENAFLNSNCERYLGAISLVALNAISLKSFSEPRTVSAKTRCPRPKTANVKKSMGPVDVTPIRMLAPT